MNEAYPDLEIYIKRVEPKLILSWLTDRLAENGTMLEGTETKANTLLCTFKKDGRNSNCAIVDKAAKGGYVSVWFKENETPWLTDRDFALEAYDFFKQEVRCSTGPWEDNLDENAIQNNSQNSDDDSEENSDEDSKESGGDNSDKGGWIRFTVDGEQIVNWLT